MDKLLSLGSGKSDRLDRNFKITGLIMLPTAVGIAIFALVLGIQAPQAKLPLLGAAALVACIGLGFLVTANIAKRWYASDHEASNNLI